MRFIFNSIVEGKTVSDVYKELNVMGIKTRTNSKFAFNSIVRIVNNEVCKGTIVSNKYLNKNSMRPKSEWNYIPDVHPTIVDEATWEKQTKLLIHIRSHLLGVGIKSIQLLNSFFLGRYKGLRRYIQVKCTSRFVVIVKIGLTCMN